MSTLPFASLGAVSPLLLQPPSQQTARPDRTAVTPQLLVQQIAYLLSDKVFSSSPETFGLDTALVSWAGQESARNIHGFAPGLVPFQTRSGAGTLALGYLLSPDFPADRRSIPQSLIAPSSSLGHLRQTLQHVAQASTIQQDYVQRVVSPVVAHIAATAYTPDKGLVAEYEEALRVAGDLGWALVTSSTAEESQHMALFASVLASIVPTLHVYDGVRFARTTSVLPVHDDGTVSSGGRVLLAEQVQRVYEEMTTGSLQPTLPTPGKGRTKEEALALAVLDRLNEALGTAYRPFEYVGPVAPEVVYVALGSSQAAAMKAFVNRTGSRVGLVSVRLYRPFSETALLEAVPASAKTLIVLGQVESDDAVADAGVSTALFTDLLTAVWLAPEGRKLAVIEKKVSSEAEAVSIVAEDSATDSTADNPASDSPGSRIRLVVLDEDPGVVKAGFHLAQSLTEKKCVTVSQIFDNLVEGGVVQTDLVLSEDGHTDTDTDTDADITYIDDAKLLKSVDLITESKRGSTWIVRIPHFKVDEVESHIPEFLRASLSQHQIQLVVVADGHIPTAIATIAKLLPLHDSSEDAPTITAVPLPEDWAAQTAATTSTKNDRLATIRPTSFAPFDKTPPPSEDDDVILASWTAAAKALVFQEAYQAYRHLRPDLPVETATIRVRENRRLTPETYDRHIFHIEFDLGSSGLTYAIGEALGIHADNDAGEVSSFLDAYGLDPQQLVQVPSRTDPSLRETRTVYQSFVQNLDLLGRPPKRFYEALAAFATDEAEQKKLAALGRADGAAEEFKQRSEVDMLTYVDVLAEFSSARPPLAELVRMIGPLKRREYSIASAQAVTPTAVALTIVVVEWVDGRGRRRIGQATRYLRDLPVGADVTVSVKPSVMKLPTSSTAPLIMAGLGTGLAPFRAFVQYRAWQKTCGLPIGRILLYLGSRHKREEYLYGEEWEAYVDAGVITLLGAAFSRDQKKKVYIQDRMRQSLPDIVQAYLREEGSFYLCGPTWPVPDVTAVLEEAISTHAHTAGKTTDPRRELERLKEAGRYVLEVY